MGSTAFLSPQGPATAQAWISPLEKADLGVPSSPSAFPVSAVHFSHPINSCGSCCDIVLGFVETPAVFFTSNTSVSPGPTLAAATAVTSHAVPCVACPGGTHGELSVPREGWQSPVQLFLLGSGSSTGSPKSSVLLPRPLRIPGRSLVRETPHFPTDHFHTHSQGKETRESWIQLLAQPRRPQQSPCASLGALSPHSWSSGSLGVVPIP